MKASPTTSNMISNNFRREQRHEGVLKENKEAIVRRSHVENERRERPTPIC